MNGNNKTAFVSYKKVSTRKKRVNNNFVWNKIEGEKGFVTLIQNLSLVWTLGMNPQKNKTLHDQRNKVEQEGLCWCQTSTSSIRLKDKR